MVKKIRVYIYRFLIRTIGRLSKGIRIALKYGLTSGRMLEYIYDNRPRGYFFVGRLIDKLYLNHPDWEAVRERKDNVKFYIKEAILEMRREGIPVRVLDIAAGYARYILEALLEVGAQGVDVICLDIEGKYAKEVEEKFKTYGINISYKQADAFDRDLFCLLPPPNIVISSGFYDWITEDEKVLKSLEIIYDILDKGGILVLTGQAKHPDLELVSCAFVDFKSQPLRMKMRSPDLIVDFLKEKNFSDIDIKMDKRGYYYTIRGRK